MKKALYGLVLIINIMITISCISIASPKAKLPEEYKGIYINIDENQSSKYFGTILILSISEDGENSYNYTSQLCTTEGCLEKQVLEIDPFDYGRYIVARGKFIPSDTRTASFYFYNEEPSEELPANNFINYERSEGKIRYIEVIESHDRYYKVTGINSIDDIKKIEKEYQEYNENLKKIEIEKQKKLLRDSKDYFIDLFANKTVYFLPQNNYIPGWKKPEPFLAELLTDGESIRFTSRSNNSLAKDKIFLLTWNKDLESDLATMATSPLSDNKEILYPSIIMNSDTNLSIIIYNDITPNYRNVLNTYGLKSNKTIFLSDITSVQQGNLFLNMMTNSPQDTEASFYIVIEE